MRRLLAIGFLALVAAPVALATQTSPVSRQREQRCASHLAGALQSWEHSSIPSSLAAGVDSERRGRKNDSVIRVEGSGGPRGLSNAPASMPYFKTAGPVSRLHRLSRWRRRGERGRR